MLPPTWRMGRMSRAQNTGERYTYDPLPSPSHIRLLVLRPRILSPALSCELVPASLHDAPDFEALSYAWGSPQPSLPIHVSDRVLSIGANLYAALQHLRHRFRQRVLWADALCINQDDLLERNAQVKIMGDIYAAATRTLIWLGEETRHTDRALAVLARCRSEHKSTNLTEVLLRTGRTAESARWLYTALSTFSQEEAAALQDLYGRPWFGRKWVIQELVLSRDPVIILGKQSMPWQVLENLSSLLKLFGQDLIYFDSSDAGMCARLHMSNASILASMRLQRFGIASTVVVTLNFRCTNPRDSIISLLGLAPVRLEDDEDLRSLADYRRSPEDLYCHFLRMAIRNTTGLWVLSLVNNVPLEERICSWVPNLSTLDLDARASMMITESPSACASRANESARFSNSGSVLGLRGRRVDRVESLGAAPRKDNKDVLDRGQSDPTLRPQRLEQISTDDEARYRDYFRLGTGRSLEAVSWDSPDDEAVLFLRAFLLDARSELSKTDISEFLEYRQARTRILARAASIPTADDHKTADTLSRLIRFSNAGKVAVNRYFCRTENGRLGWMPLFARPGDIICVFDGAKSAHVIRPASEGRYQLVGDCYVQGLMSSEVDSIGGLQSEIILLE